MLLLRKPSSQITFGKINNAGYKKAIKKFNQFSVSIHCIKNVKVFTKFGTFGIILRTTKIEVGPCN